jgi:hypothetical protein
VIGVSSKNPKEKVLAFLSKHSIYCINFDVRHCFIYNFLRLCLVPGKKKTSFDLNLIVCHFISDCGLLLLIQKIRLSCKYILYASNIENKSYRSLFNSIDGAALLG